MEQKQKQEEKKPELTIVIGVARTKARASLRPGQFSATILYEKNDVDSRTITGLSGLNESELAFGVIGQPSVRRKGIHLDTVSPQGSADELTCEWYHTQRCCV